MTLDRLKKQIADIVKPYYTIGGRDPGDGCPYLCDSCRERRHMRDEILELFDKLEYIDRSPSKSYGE